jgi:hypothetical protein
MDSIDNSFGSGLAEEQLPDETIQADGALPESQPQYVTEDILEHVLDQFSEKLTRKIQSMTDKKSDRIKKELEKKLQEKAEIYAALGLQMPEHIKQQEIERYLQSIQDQPEADEGAAPIIPDPIVEAVNRRAALIEKRYGVTLNEDDPEIKLVNFRTLDPMEYLESREAAVKAKAARLKGAGQGAPSVPAARSPAIGQGQPSGDLMAQYLREIQSVRPGSEEALQIRRKYRQKGLAL